jgi:hypothetical protein
LGQTILINENFEDNDFTSRDWYDGAKGTISTVEHVDGSTACFECKFLKGQKSCSGGTPSRHLFTETDEMYVSYWVKYSANWEGSNKPYHPHEFNIMTNIDDKYVGPAITHLTMYIEQNEGRPLLALQDSKNVDQNCILQNNGGFIGCNGNFDIYKFTEERSVAACNGIMGGYDRKDCFFYGSGYYYSARIWDMDTVYFTDQIGPHYKNDWHHVEAYFKMNSIVVGKGVTDGKIRYWYDSQLLISYDNILMRTGQFPNMKFNQFLIAPYIGDGSPIDQTMWIDNLTVATAPISSDVNEALSNFGYTSEIVTDQYEFDVPNANLQIDNIKVYNLYGELTIESSDIRLNLSGDKTIIVLDVTGLSSGLYFVRVGGNIRKFVKI